MGGPSAKKPTDLAQVRRSAPVERAFREVPRHRFIPRRYYVREGGGFTAVDYDPEHPTPDQLDVINSGRAVVTQVEGARSTSSCSDAALVAQMLDLLDLRLGMRVLEIGTGTGYNAALLAEIVGDPALVSTVDSQPEVVDQARRALEAAGYSDLRVQCADGFFGDRDRAPYDRVIATAGCPDLSPHWFEQLAPDGRMLIPLRHAGMNPLLLLGGGTNDTRAPAGRFVGSSGFMAIRGELADDSYYGRTEPSDDAPHEEFPTWADLADPAPSASLGFWFHAGIRDSRTQVTGWSPFRLALVDPGTGEAVSLDRDRIVLRGALALLDDLTALHEEWVELGSPTMADYSVRFVPSGHAAPAESTVPDPHWAMPGRYHTRVLSLDFGSPA